MVLADIGELAEVLNRNIPTLVRLRVTSIVSVRNSASSFLSVFWGVIWCTY